MFTTNLREVYGDTHRSEKGEIASNLIFMAAMAIMAVVVGGMLARSITNAGVQTSTCIENPSAAGCKDAVKDTTKRDAGKKAVEDRYK